ncbi:hypothetical protein BGY98DRAFT_955792 [Russula aff. rugulosa BPL654]|nr:hypothetical protein BGY98DRAFT_955792 [Russula aff. rugulosa BPL654]
MSLRLVGILTISFTQSRWWMYNAFCSACPSASGRASHVKDRWRESCTTGRPARKYHTPCRDGELEEKSGKGL